MAFDNPNPIFHGGGYSSSDDDDDDVFDIHSTKITRSEIYELIRDIKDPEHPYTLSQLKVVRKRHISVFDDEKICVIDLMFTPTVPHCSLASVIGLCIREKLTREITKPFKLEIKVSPGSHDKEVEINKRVNDKERVVAALENPFLKEMIEEYINYVPVEMY